MRAVITAASVLLECVTLGVAGRAALLQLEGKVNLASAVTKTISALHTEAPKREKTFRGMVRSSVLRKSACLCRTL